MRPICPTRREFIQTTLASLAVASCGGAFSALSAASTEKKTLVGSNVYGWTQYAQRDKKPLNMDEVLSALRDAGYDYLETFMNLAQPDENGKFADQLKAKGMQPVSLYTGARLHEPGKADESVAKVLAAAKICHQAGFEVISCNPDPIGREKTDEELKTQAAALKSLGEGLAGLGMQIGVHHHLPELANKAREFHYVFKNTDPKTVGWCYDVHWVWKGGIQPLDALKQYGDRVVTWHIRQSRDRIWWEDLDTGDVDYAAVAEYAKAHKLPRRFTVELAIESGTKITRSAAENHQRSREFIRKVFEA